MNPHRPRKPRSDGAALRYLDQWGAYVVRAERVARRGGDDPYRPCCGVLVPAEADDARARLERLMRNGGRRAHRLRVAVIALDERFRAATVEIDAWKSTPWWERRRVEWEL